MFFDESRLLEQSWYRVTMEIFLPSYNEIGPVVSDKIFQVFYKDIYRENKPQPLAAMFFDNPNDLNNLGTESQRNISAKLYSNWSSGFWQEDFLSFLYRYIGKMSPAPWRPYFLTNPNGLNNLGRESPKEHFCKIIWKSVQWFQTRRFVKFSI